MGHHNHHGTTSYGRAFVVGIVLNVGFVIVEIIYGGMSHSLALVGDAAHNFSDVFALVLAWAASILVQRRATQQYTYGLRRTSIWASLINAVMLLVVTGAIAWEAIRRLNEPGDVQAQTVVGVAALGIL